MKAAAIILLSLAALAHAGPAVNKNNQIGADSQAYYNKQHMTTNTQEGAAYKQTQTTETLKQWCFSSQMSQPELTASFKKLVSSIKSDADTQSTEAAVMSERLCQGAQWKSGASANVDPQAHELIKDVYMDALLACDAAHCKQQLVKIIDSQDVDSIRAAYYMTRVAVTEADAITDADEIKQLFESIQQQHSTASSSEAIERQKLFATTSLIAKALSANKSSVKPQEIKQTAEQVAKLILERYIKPVTRQEVEQYAKQQPEQQSAQVAQKIAKRSAALKALANIPGYILKEISEVEKELIELAKNKAELSTVRQSAIEALEENESAWATLKQIAFDQSEPTEVRVACLRTCMSSIGEQKSDSAAAEIVEQLVKHCEQPGNQQTDDQFVLYAISFLDNLRSSQQPEHKAVKECIAKNKQLYMQIQLLNKKFKQQLNDVRKSSRNYKLEQEFNQLESGLVIEGDLIYESEHSKSSSYNLLPKLIRVNMSMPVMGKTVNVIEIAVRQNQMDDELVEALKLISSGANKMSGETVGKVVDSFKQAAEKTRTSGSASSASQKTAEADLSIKIDGCTVVYMSVDDFKTASSHQRSKRATSGYIGGASLVDELVDYLTRNPVAFNRGFNFNLNERLARVLDVEANIIAGLRFDAHSTGQSADDYEIQAQIEPRFAFEAIVGPSASAKKFMQRVSTKTALGLRMRYKADELVDIELDLPMNTMELFTVESQIVEKSATKPLSYTYLPESFYGQEDIYSVDGQLARSVNNMFAAGASSSKYSKRAIFERESTSKQIAKFIQGKSALAYTAEIPEELARATGLRGKLRMAASPKDMSVLVQCVAEKYEPSMSGYRFQVQQVSRGASGQKQYTVTMSTPGSRIERTMQVRAAVQSTSQRTYIKTEVQTPKNDVVALWELVHDGRSYAAKAEIASSRGSQWRHAIECGVQRGSQSQSGRVATSFKPYFTINSSALKRPVAMQGIVSYQETPKTVISYEFKCQTTGDFVSGQLVIDQSQAGYSKRSVTRRAMTSPIDLVFDQDLTMSGEHVAQIAEHTMKVHKMLEWNADKKALVTSTTATYKNARKPTKDAQWVSSLKLSPEQQAYSVERKCPQQDQKDYRFTLASELTPSAHHMMVDCRYNGKRQSVAAYKHKIELGQISSSKAEIAFTVEVVASEHQLNEKFAGRMLANLADKTKTLKTEMNSRNKSAKVEVAYISLDEHTIEVAFQSPAVQHRCSVHATKSQYSLQSRTDKRNQLLAKLSVEASKQAPVDCKIVFEAPAKRVACALDLQLSSGKQSSVAIQTPRFTSRAEWAFDAKRAGRSSWSRPLSSLQGLRFKSDLKDQLSQENYWIDSAYAPSGKSFVRFDSPVYRTDFELNPTESSAMFGAFARSKRSISGQLYSLDDSSLKSGFANKMSLGADKAWMARSLLSSAPMKSAARRALFEYADRSQAHKHSLDFSPADQRATFALDRQPNMDFGVSSVSPMRLTGDLSSPFTTYQKQRPSSLNMQSDYVDLDFETQPFGKEESYARISALSRHPRSAFKKHESEMRYNKKAGYKAYMKHVDAEGQRHQAQFDADVSPKKWAKISYEADKHGKAAYEHKWRKYAKKADRSGVDSDVWANKVAFERQSPSYSHSSQFEWDEPMRMSGRPKRSVDYSTMSYLNSIGARLNSQTSRTANPAEQLYKMDFDFAPESYNARLNVAMPLKSMLHESAFEYEPSERAYKLHSKYSDVRTKVPTYELLATSSGKPVAAISGLATAEQEPLFADEHPMLAGISNTKAAMSLFRQPVNVAYSDKYGRSARFDYNLAPELAAAASRYEGLRKKRAAMYYKDNEADFEHSSSYDFYPETFFAPSSKLAAYKRPASSSADASDFGVDMQTKYGPVNVHASASDANAIVALESPIASFKLITEEAIAGSNKQLIKFQVHNKQQSAKLAKIARKALPTMLAESDFVRNIAAEWDQNRWEHSTECLVSLDDAILKAKSQTLKNQRPVLAIDAELNKPQEKAYAKITGERINGQLVADLANKSCNWMIDVDNKRTFAHQTRLVQVSDKFYQLDSTTTYKQQPALKLAGKVSSMILSEPKHLFARRGASWMGAEDAHISSFEAIVYQPKQLQMSAQYDCINKEAHIVFKNAAEKRIQETLVKYDDKIESIIFDSRLTSPIEGQVYVTKAKLNLPGLVQSSKCYSNPSSCRSEFIYTEQSGKNWSANYVPNQYIAVSTPHGRETLNLAY